MKGIANKMVSAKCPSCSEQTPIILKPRIGLTVRCSSCEAELEVVWLDPIELDWPYDDDDVDEYDDDFWED